MNLRKYFIFVFFLVFLYDLIYYMYFFNEIYNAFSLINMSLLNPGYAFNEAKSNLASISTNPLFLGFTSIILPFYTFFQFIYNVLDFFYSVIAVFINLITAPFSIFPYPINIIFPVVFYMILAIYLLTSIRILESGLSNE